MRQRPLCRVLRNKLLVSTFAAVAVSAFSVYLITRYSAAAAGETRAVGDGDGVVVDDEQPADEPPNTHPDASRKFPVHRAILRPAMNSCAKPLRRVNMTMSKSTIRPTSRLLHRIRQTVNNPFGGRRRIASTIHGEPNGDLSPLGQSAFVDRQLDGRRRGFFVDIGAGDGASNSRTLFLEINRTWTGLLIDENPYCYPTLLSRRHKVKTLNACLTPTSGETTIKTFHPPTDIGKAASKYHPRGSNVSCYAPVDIMTALSIRHIDYLSLNTFDEMEAELTVLRAIDWKTMPVTDVISVECLVKGKNGQKDDAATSDKLEKIRTLMEETGIYTELAILGDVYMSHRRTN